MWFAASRCEIVCRVQYPRTPRALSVFATRRQSPEPIPRAGQDNPYSVYTVEDPRITGAGHALLISTKFHRNRSRERRFQSLPHTRWPDVRVIRFIVYFAPIRLDRPIA